MDPRRAIKYSFNGVRCITLSLYRPAKGGRIDHPLGPGARVCASGRVARTPPTRGSSKQNSLSVVPWWLVNRTDRRATSNTKSLSSLATHRLLPLPRRLRYASRGSLFRVKSRQLYKKGRASRWFSRHWRVVQQALASTCLQR